MKLKTKIELILIASFVMIGLLSVKSFATSISVTSSKETVTSGETFNVTVTGSDATGKVGISVENGTASQSTVWIENNSATFTVTAGSSGTVKISAVGELSNSSGTDSTVSGSVSVDIGTTSVNSNNYSTTVTSDVNVNLSNLGIRPYDFSGFKAATTSYSVNVPNDCTSVEVYATAQSSSAKISGTGTRTLKEGTNVIEVTVTNGSASKKYRISVVRATSDGDIPPNVIEGEDEDTDETEENVGIGLASLEIAGYELDKEFKTDVYEYTVKIQEELTLSVLEEIKEKILMTTNDENVSTEVAVELLENGEGRITIIVKDDEKEYARYIINFVREEEEEEEVPLITGFSSGNNSDITGIFGLSLKYMVGIIMICYGITLLFATYFAINCYLKSKKLLEYEEDSFNDEDELAKVNRYNEDLENDDVVTENSEVAQTVEEPKEESSDISSRLKKLSGYRNLRSTGKSSGRHF